MTKRGFTLIELLVVIAIIGLLSSIVFASLVLVRYRALDARRLADAATIQTALEQYSNTHPDYPATALVSPGVHGWVDSRAPQPWIPGLDSSIIASVPVDPVNIIDPEQVYYYRSDGTHYCIQIPQVFDVSSSPFYMWRANGTYKLRFGDDHAYCQIP